MHETIASGKLYWLGPQAPPEVSHIDILDISGYDQSGVHAVNNLLHAIGNTLKHVTLNFNDS